MKRQRKIEIIVGILIVCVVYFIGMGVLDATLNSVWDQERCIERDKVYFRYNTFGTVETIESNSDFYEILCVEGYTLGGEYLKK